jgi:hypothetical protein
VLAGTGTPSSTLVPGGTADLVLTLKNTNSYSVTIVSIAANGVPNDPGSGCTGANSKVTVSASQPGLPLTVPSGNPVNVTIANGATMAVDSASACQGKHFQIPVTITVHR